MLVRAAAAHRMPGRGVRERRHGPGAGLGGVLAAGREGAARRPLAHADGDARDAAQRARMAEVGDRRHQCARVRVTRSLDDLGGGRVLDDPPGVHDDDAVGHARHDREVVRDVDHRHALLVAEAVELAEDAILREHVEAGRGLVEHGDRRLAHARHRDRHALLLPARELMRIAADEARVRSELDALERRVQRLGASPRRSDGRAARRRIASPTRSDGLSAPPGSCGT